MSAQQLSLIEPEVQNVDEPGDEYVITDRWDVVDGRPNAWVYVKQGCIGLSHAYRANQVPMGGLRTMSPAEAESLGRALIYWAKAVRAAS